MTEGNVEGQEVPTPGDLRELVESLAKQRKLAAGLKEVATVVEKAVQATAEWKAWTDARALVTAAGRALVDLEAKVREQALTLARMANTKEPAPGVKVVRRIDFEVVDQAALETWARAYAPTAWQLDVNLLGKLVLAMPPEIRTNIPGAKVVEAEYGSVRIDRDLAPIYLRD